MPSWSSLRAPVMSGARHFLNNTKRSPRFNVPVRRGGNGSSFDIQPSRFIWFRAKDEINFYALLALIPLSSFVLYQSIVYGPAELKDTPEDYVPLQHEYYRHPVSRKIVQLLGGWFLPSFEKSYESTLYHMWKRELYHTIREDHRRMKELMKERQDQYNFYFVPALGKHSDREDAYYHYKVTGLEDME